MLIALPLSVAAVGAIVWRHAERPLRRSPVVWVAALGLLLRLMAALVESLIAHQSHWTDVWLSDEASFFLATEALLPNPFDHPLPAGLDHLAGDSYLGLTTAVAMMGGVADAHAFRVVDAALGTCVVILSMLVARRLFGPRAALVSGAVLAVWPPLLLWSATMLRDTLGGFAVVATWWLLGNSGSRTRLVALVCALVIAAGLRDYLATAMAVGMVGWALEPILRQQRARVLLVGAAALIGLGVVVGVAERRQLDYATHQLLYRQTMTRLEALGLLYVDAPPARGDLPMKPGTAVGVAEPGSGWILGGVVQDFEAPQVARVVFADTSVREVPVSELVPLQSTSIPPLQLLASLGPNLADFLLGSSPTGQGSSRAWTAAALAWDALFILAVAGLARARLTAREWLYPACIVAATTLALVAIPSAPGNADRHRTTQTIPMLVVFASGLAFARRTRSVQTAPTAEPDAAALAVPSANSRNQSSSISSAQM